MILLRVMWRDARRSSLLVLAALLLDIVALAGQRAGWVHPEISIWLMRLLMLAIGADVVFGDPVSGPDARWRTRPVSGISMSIGKTLMLAGVAFGMGGAMFGVEHLAGGEMSRGVFLGLWEVFGAALWVLLGAALAALVEKPRGFLVQGAGAMTLSAAIVVVVLLLSRQSEWIAHIAARGAREQGRAVMLAGGIAMLFAFGAVACRYMWPHRIWTARFLAWFACLCVLGHEGLRLLAS